MTCNCSLKNTKDLCPNKHNQFLKSKFWYGHHDLLTRLSNKPFEYKLFVLCPSKQVLI